MNAMAAPHSGTYLPEFGEQAQACPAPWRMPTATRERFRRLRASLPSSQGRFLLGVCGVRPGEGASWVAARLACALAETEPAVSVVNLDGSGANGEDWGEANPLPDLSPWRVRRSAWPHLTLLQPLQATGAAELVAGVPTLSGTTVVDCGSFSHSSWALRFGSLWDSLLLVVQARRHRREELLAVVHGLRRAGVPLSGLVLNQQEKDLPPPLDRWL